MNGWVVAGLIVLGVIAYAVIGGLSGRYAYGQVLEEVREHRGREFWRTPESRAREGAWCMAIGWPIYWLLMGLGIVAIALWNFSLPVINRVDAWMTGGRS